MTAKEIYIFQQQELNKPLSQVVDDIVEKIKSSIKQNPHKESYFLERHGVNQEILNMLEERGFTITSQNIYYTDTRVSKFGYCISWNQTEV